jgi:hypothetical protein
MPEMIFVRPARDQEGRPCLVPRDHKVVMRRLKDGGWPEGAIAADGELLPLTTYIKDLLRRRDVEEVSPPSALPPADAPVPPAADTAAPPAVPTSPPAAVSAESAVEPRRGSSRKPIQPESSQPGPGTKPKEK